jgi:hypothetical protein
MRTAPPQPNSRRNSHEEAQKAQNFDTIERIPFLRLFVPFCG